METPVSGVHLALNLLREGDVTHGSGKIYFDTDDIEALEAFVREKGVETKPIEDIPDMVSILLVIDPDGNEIGFVSPPRVKSK
ncbi:MAG: hypothetical protein RTU30_07850 [Candidatus Thorarchaeota archaeon]